MPRGMAVAARSGTVEREFNHSAVKQGGGIRLFRLKSFRSRSQDPITIAVEQLKTVLHEGSRPPQIRPTRKKLQSSVLIAEAGSKRERFFLLLHILEIWKSLE